jgi:hypothetical protein
LSPGACVNRDRCRKYMLFARAQSQGPEGTTKKMLETFENFVKVLLMVMVKGGLILGFRNV